MRYLHFCGNIYSYLKCKLYYLRLCCNIYTDLQCSKIYTDLKALINLRRSILVRATADSSVFSGRKKCFVKCRSGGETDRKNRSDGRRIWGSKEPLLRSIYRLKRREWTDRDERVYSGSGFPAASRRCSVPGGVSGLDSKILDDLRAKQRVE